MKIKTISGLLIIAVTLGVSLMGCGRVRPTMKTAGAMVQKELHRKYGIETEVEKVYEESGSQLFDRSTYQVELHLKGKSDKKFRAAVKVDGSKYMDDYSQLIYQPGFEKMVQEQIDALTDYPTTYEFHCLMIEEKYTKPSEWKMFINGARESVDVKFKVPLGEKHEEIAKEMTPFLEKLRTMGFSTTIEVYQDEKRILCVTASPRTDGIDYDEMLKWFRKTE